MKRTLFINVLCMIVVGVYATPRDTLRMVTYNIHHASPPSQPAVINTNAIAACLQKTGADIIALQEVDVYTKRSGNINEAQVLADKLHYYWYFAKAIDYDGGDYGIAILSKFQLADTQTIRLPMDSSLKGEPRVMAIATVKLPGGHRITVLCTHLDHLKPAVNRELQLSRIFEYTSKVSTPLIVAGDFNAEENSPAIRQFDSLFQRTCNNCAFTFPAILPVKTIDFIGFSRGRKTTILSHEVINETFASDHRPVKAVLLFQ